MNLNGRSLVKVTDLTAGEFTYLGPGDSQLGRKESVKDTARVLGRTSTASNTVGRRSKRWKPSPPSPVSRCGTA